MSNIDERLSKVNANDRRVKRTKKLLRDSLFSLLQKKSIKKCIKWVTRFYAIRCESPLIVYYYKR